MLKDHIYYNLLQNFNCERKKIKLFKVRLFSTNNSAM